jgi:RsiW-degrading membrane proteinase PrsW (M82 family)
MSTALPPAAAPPAAPSPAGHDALFIALACVSVVLSIGSAVAEALHLLPSGLGVVLVLAFASVGIRVMLRLRGRRSSALSNPAVMNIVSLVLLGVSFVMAIVNLSVALQGHDPSQFVVDALQHGWSLLLLMAVAIPARTMGWRAILGVVLVGILAVSSLALTVDRPVVDALGADDQFAVAFFVPLTEEILKALPVAIFAIMAVRNRAARPSAIDFGILGFASGMGFALIEDADFGRVTGRFDAVPPISAIFPSMDTTAGFASAGYVIAGHAIWTGFIGLALGFGILYTRRWRFAWIAIPVALALTVTEHSLDNADLPPAPLVALTANGLLVTILFVLGFIGLAVLERRRFTKPADILGGVLVSQPSLGLQRANLAARQARRVPAVPVAPTSAAAAVPVTPNGENR